VIQNAALWARNPREFSAIRKHIIKYKLDEGSKTKDSEKSKAKKVI
jgi:hypothetical protein